MLGRVFHAEVRARQWPTVAFLHDINERRVDSTSVGAIQHPRSRVPARGWRGGLVSSAALTRRVCSRREDESVDSYCA